MPAKNIEKRWKLPKYTDPPEGEFVKGQLRPWWFHYFNSTKKEDVKKCPICRYRVAITKTVGKTNDISCFECARLHYRTIRVQIGDRIIEKNVYMSTKDILGENK